MKMSGIKTFLIFYFQKNFCYDICLCLMKIEPVVLSFLSLSIVKPLPLGGDIDFFLKIKFYIIHITKTK